MSATSGQLGAAGKAAILLAGLLPTIAMSTIAVMLPAISDAFDGARHSLMIKMVSTAGGLGMMFGAPIGGLVADRVGRRRTFLTACLVFALAGLAMMLADALWQLIAARFAVGFCAGASATCVFALIADHFPREVQGRWLGYNSGLSPFLAVVITPLAGLLVDSGWRHGFLVYGFALPIFLLALISIPRSVQRPEIAAPARGLRLARLPWRTLLLAVVAGTVATGTSLYWPFKLRELGVLQARDLALYAVPNVLAITLGAFSYGLVRRWLSMTHVFAVAGLLSMAGLLLAALATAPLQVLFGLIVEGLAVGLLTPNLSMYAISIAPQEARASTIGLMKGAVYGSPFLTQFPLEMINKAGGTSAALAGIATLGGAMGIAMAMLGFWQRRHPAEGDPA